MHEPAQSITQQGDGRVAESTRQGGGRLTECVEESGTAVAMRAGADQVPSPAESGQINAKTVSVRAQSPDQAPWLAALNQNRTTTGPLRALPGAERTQASTVNAPSITAWFNTNCRTVLVPFTQYHGYTTWVKKKLITQPHGYLESTSPRPCDTLFWLQTGVVHDNSNLRRERAGTRSLTRKQFILDLGIFFECMYGYCFIVSSSTLSSSIFF